MAYELLRVGTATTFEIISTTTGAVVFTGDLEATMREFSRLSLQAKGMARAGTKMQKRAEKQQAGVR